MVWLVDVGLWATIPKIDGCSEEPSPSLHILFTHIVVWSSNNNTSLIWMELIYKDIVSLKRTQSIRIVVLLKALLQGPGRFSVICVFAHGFGDGALKSNSTGTPNVTEILTGTD